MIADRAGELIMKSKWPCVLIMGSISLALASLLDILIARETVAGLPSLWVSWIASLLLTALVAWRSASVRGTWAFLSFINGAMSVAIALADAARPAAASAAYEPGSDWLRAVDFTPPIAARLREAVASGYFGIGVGIAAAIFLAIAYLLRHRSHGSSRHAH